jgi:hypothetical protein
MSGESSGLASKFPAEPSNKTQDSNTHLLVMTTPFGRAVFGAPNIRWWVTYGGHNHGPYGPNKSNKGRLACDVDEKIGRGTHRYFSTALCRKDAFSIVMKPA